MRIESFHSICNTGWMILAIGLILGTNSPLQSEEPNAFPYTAVLLEEAPIQSGPHADFYPTDRLEKGQRVDIYRVDNKDWLAIRPPRDSFSWVRAEHLELTESGTRARVINTPAKTRVGSRLGDIHDVEYISLNKGEVLELLGTKILRDPETGDERRWFKVAPPSGEFRWVHKDMVARVDQNDADADDDAEAIKTFSLPTEPKSKEPTLNLAQPVAESSTALPTASSELNEMPEEADSLVTTTQSMQSLQREVDQAINEQLAQSQTSRSTPTSLENAQSSHQIATKPIATKPIATQPITTEPIATEQITTQQLPASPAEQVATTAIPTRAIESESNNDDQWSRKEPQSPSDIAQAAYLVEAGIPAHSTAAKSNRNAVSLPTTHEKGTHHGFRVVSNGESGQVSDRKVAPPAQSPQPDANRDSDKSIATTHINAVTWEAVTDPKNPLAAPEPRTFEASYEALNILLSRSVLGDIEQWKLERVQEQAVLLQRAARNRDQLALADQLAAKIRKFQDLQKRKLAMQAELLAQAVSRSNAEAEVDAALARAEQTVASSTQTRSKQRGRTRVELASYSAEDLANTSESSEAPGRLPHSVIRSNFQAMPRSKVARKKQGPAMPRRVSSRTAEVFPPSKLRPAAALDNSVFDATGTLITVHAKRNGLPRYALTDSRGQITRFVSTGDGSSLDHLVNSKVGLLGEIGLLSELNKSHIIAVRAVKLSR